MTTPRAFGRTTRAFPSVPRGEALGTYDSYLEAQDVVDRLAKADFDVAKLSIVGNDLKIVERVTGKLSWGRSAAGGAASGAWFGMFFGVLLVLFTPDSSLAFVVAAVLIGAGFGVIFGLVGYAVNRRSRDFTSTHQVLASNYQVLIAPDLLLRARELLARGDAAER